MSARADLCGGRSAMVVPTATSVTGSERKRLLEQLLRIRFGHARPSNLNHDGRNQGQQKAGKLRMSGPDDLSDAEHP